MVQIAFGIEKLKVSLLHKTPTDTVPLQLASAKIAGLQAEFELQTSKMRLSVSMGSLRVKDSSEKYKKDPKWRYLLSSGNTEGTDRFFAAVLESTPRDGALFAGVEHQVLYYCYHLVKLSAYGLAGSSEARDCVRSRYARDLRAPARYRASIG